MKPKRFASPLLAAAALVVAVSATPSLHASTISWDGDDSTSWTTGTNWVGDIAPANSLFTDIALFNLASYTNQPDAGTTSINGISVGSSSGTLNISGTSLSIGSGGITVAAGAGATTISAPITVGHDWQSWTNNSSNLLSVGSISRATGTGVNFTPGTGGINTTNTNTNGILGGWATVGNGGGSGATADWATVDGSGNIVAYTGYTDVASGNQTGAGASTQNWRTVNTGAVTTLTTSATINSLVVRSDFSVSSGATMTLDSGGLILSGISRWILNNGAGSTAGTGQITSGLASGELFVDVASSAADANNWRIWTKLVDNGGTAVKLVKTGPGDLGLLNSNSYTGGTYLNSGTLSIANGGSLGTGDLRMNGGSLNIRYASANVDLANNVVISGSNDINLGVARNLSLNGTISGSGQLTLGNSNHNSSIYLNGANTMTSGTITLVNNTNSVRFASASAGNANVAWVFNNTSANRNTLDFAGGGTISFGSMTGNGRIDGNGAGLKTISAGALGLDDTFSGTINNGSGTLALTKVGNGTMTLSGASSYTGGTNLNGGAIQLNNASALGTSGTISFGGGTLKYGTVTTDLSARFSNAASQAYKVDTNGQNVAFASALTSSGGSLAKSGTGTLTLNGANTYTGLTTINGGTLALGAAGSINNTSGVHLGTSGTFDVSAKSGYTVSALSGSGTVTGTLTVSTELAIGNSPGTVNFSGDLTLGSGATYTYEMVGGGTEADLGDVAGNLTLTGSILDLVQLGTFTVDDKFTLFAYDGTLTGTFDGLADDSIFTDGGGEWLINYNDTEAGANGGTGTSYVTITAVPEPGAALLGGLGLLALLRRRRVA